MTTLDDLARTIHDAHRAHQDRTGRGIPIIDAPWDDARLGAFEWYRDEQRSIARAVVLALADDIETALDPGGIAQRWADDRLRSLVAEARGND